mmetsp:Transcript_3729/g.11208  ORF Transcript_3729/g.11208 Transcript_3729/m.11208 type:complete len:267 (+) Transcript_3729:411-1211(+)
MSASLMSLTKPPGSGFANATLPSLPLVTTRSFALGRSSAANLMYFSRVFLLPSSPVTKLSGATTMSANSRIWSSSGLGFSASTKIGIPRDLAHFATASEASACLPSRTRMLALASKSSTPSKISFTSASVTGCAKGVWIHVLVFAFSSTMMYVKALVSPPRSTREQSIPSLSSSVTIASPVESSPTLETSLTLVLSVFGRSLLSAVRQFAVLPPPSCLKDNDRTLSSACGYFSTLARQSRHAAPTPTTSPATRLPVSESKAARLLS